MRFRNQTVAAAAFILLIAPLGLAQDPPAEEEVEVVGVRDVSSDHVGEEITVGGRALQVRIIRGSGVHISFMSGFRAIIPDTQMHLWKEVDIVKRYEGRNLQVTGEIMEDNDQLFVGVTDPEQLKIVPRRRRRR